jgi:hypothetical protein
MKNIKILSALILSAFTASCTLSGDTKNNGVLKFITGASKVDAVKDVHIINIARAIGSPSSSIAIDKYKYYKWEYSRSIGVSTILGGGSTTFYCNLSAETLNNKVKMLTWYGNQCDIFLDQINEYFKDKMNVVAITEDEIKQQQIVITKTDLSQKEKELNKKPIVEEAAPIVPAIDVKTIDAKTPEVKNPQENKETSPTTKTDDLKKNP